MNEAQLFKALHRQLKFRNPDSIIQISPDSDIFQKTIHKLTQKQLDESSSYLDQLRELEISYTYPGHYAYPSHFYQMLEPPLFLEYIGHPVWLDHQILSVVGSRKIHPWTEKWLYEVIPEFLNSTELMAVASGGAIGVDQCAHWAAVKSLKPTIVVLPCGVRNLYPLSLQKIKDYVLEYKGVYLSEFEYQQPVRKHLFFYRNRLIAALGKMTLVAQAELRSGSLLTVHHALANGRSVVTLPAHPMMMEFSGNLHLIKEGCFYVANSEDLLNFWEAESWSGRGLTLDANHI